MGNRSQKEMTNIHRSYGIIAFKKDSSAKMEFLLVKNKSGNHWGFPKGTPETGESNIETARREFQEETGIKAPERLSDVTFEEEYDFKGEDGEMIHKVNTYFLGEIFDIERASEVFDDIEDVAWKSTDEALDTLTFPRSKEILAQVQRDLSL